MNDKYTKALRRPTSWLWVFVVDSEEKRLRPRCLASSADQWQLEQDPDVQPAQADDDFVWCSTPDMPKVDGLRSTSFPPQDGHVTDAVRENISFSNSVWHRAQRNSKIGMLDRSQQG